VVAVYFINKKVTISRVSTNKFKMVIIKDGSPFSFRGMPVPIIGRLGMGS
jgi:hypothetical protein